LHHTPHRDERVDVTGRCRDVGALLLVTDCVDELLCAAAVLFGAVVLFVVVAAVVLLAVVVLLDVVSCAATGIVSPAVVDATVVSV